MVGDVPAAQNESYIQHLVAGGHLCRQNYLTETETVEKPFFELTEALLHKSIPFHYGDERLMEAYGTDEDGYLCIGRCRYRRANRSA